MNIGIIGGGINGLCCAWRLAELGHQVRLYERSTVMGATSRASSKLLHGGLRYLENCEFRLVREALHERDAWIQRAPDFAKPLRLTVPIYRSSRRPQWMVGAGLWLYDRLARGSPLPRAKHLRYEDILSQDNTLNKNGLLGGFEYSDGQMDDLALGLWVADQGKALGVVILEHTEILRVTLDAVVVGTHGAIQHDWVVNVGGPWATHLLERSGIRCPYHLDLVRGSHLVLSEPRSLAYILEIPDERRIFFVLPWKGKTLVGTTEIRQLLGDSITCSTSEEEYLLKAYRHYFPASSPMVVERFAGLRPLLYSDRDANRATRESVVYRTGKLVTVLGGKWTTAMALAHRVSMLIH